MTSFDPATAANELREILENAEAYGASWFEEEAASWVGSFGDDLLAFLDSATQAE